ncbi:MAG: ATP-binding cassette domain-containing protein [Pseudomonadota bacterium]|nr:ATP-binding cassette domain-containing protein [Pseudomonadota bacterium]
MANLQGDGKRDDCGKSGLDILPLEVDGLGYAVRDQWLLKDVSFTLGAGKRTCIVGPNGAGKSVLLRLCHGLLQPSAGSIRWAAGSSRQQRRQQAMVFQNPIHLRRSARANVEFALSVQGLDRSTIRERTARVLEETGLDSIASRPARVLSGGEQQRLALARAWALQPRVLFLDEPVVHLDPAATRMVEDLILRIDGGGAKIIMVSHDLGQVRRLADEVIFLHNGRLIEHSPATRFLGEARSAQARAFVKGELIY